MPKPTIHPEIPPGSSCYGYHYICPHWGHRQFNGVDIVWCRHLGRGGLRHDTTDEDMRALEEHYGYQEQVDVNGERFRLINDHPDLRSSMLWDQLSECHDRAEIERGWACERTHDEISLIVRETGDPAVVRRPYEVWGRVRKSFSAAQRTRQVLRFLASLPDALEGNCGTLEAEVNVRSLPPWRRASCGVAVYTLSAPQKNKTPVNSGRR